MFLLCSKQEHGEIRQSCPASVRPLINVACEPKVVTAPWIPHQLRPLDEARGRGIDGPALRGDMLESGVKVSRIAGPDPRLGTVAMTRL